MSEVTQSHTEIETLTRFVAGEQVLAHPEVREFTNQSLALLGAIIGGEAQTLFPLESDGVFGEHVSDTPATDIDEAVKYLVSAAQEFNAKQQDPSRPRNERHTQDYKAVQNLVDARLAEEDDRNLRGQMEDWYLHGAGRRMVETTYLRDGVKKVTAFVNGGANMSSQDRQVALLASLAGEKFRVENGLLTRDDMTFNGEDGRSPGWARDGVFRASLLERVKQRIETGEIEPTIAFGGSGDRLLKTGKPGELELVESYLVEGVPRLFQEKERLTEADAMLAGALRVWEGDIASLVIEDLPVAEGQSPAKIARFRSSVGVEITGIFTTGSETSIRGQLNRLAIYDPRVFEDKESLIAETTSIYQPAHHAILLEFGLAKGLPKEAVECFGHSTHAVGTERETGMLVSEQVKAVIAVGNIAGRVVRGAERYSLSRAAVLGIAGVGWAGVTDPRL